MRYIVRLSVENKSKVWFVKNIELSAPAIVLPKTAFNELAYELTQDERYMY